MTELVTVTTESKPGLENTTRKIKWQITSASDGTADGGESRAISGEIIKSAILPGTGDDQPSDLFDIEVQDADGYDVLCGQGANLSNSDTTTIVGDMSAVVDDALTVSASGMGDTKTATVIVYVR